jgi:hypothetical protein
VNVLGLLIEGVHNRQENVQRMEQSLDGPKRETRIPRSDGGLGPQVKLVEEVSVEDDGNNSCHGRVHNHCQQDQVCDQPK